MKKNIFQSCFFALSLILILTSCDTLRKTPDKRSPSRSGRPTLTNRRPEARRATDRRATDRRATDRRATTRPPVRKSTSPKPQPAYSTRSTIPPNEMPQVIQVARTYTGTPYRSGGNDKNGIDCSGLICSVYSEMGMKVPRISWQQSEFGQEVTQLTDIRTGDWLFFVPEAGKEGYVSHAGIVTDVKGPNEIFFIHASTSRGVREDNLFSTYFKGRFVKAMRPF